MTQTDAIRLVRHAEIIKAFAEGKQIQVSVPGSGKHPGGWMNINDPSFDREDEGAYRVKPQPRTKWICEFRRKGDREIQESCASFASKEEAEKYGNDVFDEFIRVVKFVEVPE